MSIDLHMCTHTMPHYYSMLGSTSVEYNMLQHCLIQNTSKCCSFGSDAHIYSCSYCGAVYYLPLSAPPVTNQQSMVSTVFPLSLEYFQLLQDSLKLTLKKFQQYMADQWLAILAWWVYSINYTKKSNSLIQTFTYPRL